MRGHDESDSSDNPGIFRGLVDLMASIDHDLRQHLENATVFKGTSKTVQNEILDCMLAVLRERIVEEVKAAKFLAIQADETTDISTHCQLVMVLRYIDQRNRIQERFFEFIKLPNACADAIASALSERLRFILPQGQERKLIAQAYDGAAVMRGTTGGVQRKIQDIYANAHYVHCYAHQLNLVCDTIMSHAKERFSFTKHLVSATLLQGDLFQQHSKNFPDAALQTTVEAYPSLDKARLKTELSLIYDNEEFQSCSGALALYQVLMENNLQDTFTETVSLLNILITTPMTTSESERCFSTLKRIKTFLRNNMAQDRLNALAMLSIEKKLTQELPDFNTRVIEKFATQKDRRAKFLYK
ncbi:unnamed protein product [Oreochromis niloticus]|nr:unnamed protein product [Mustela putorius furo]